ncbi:hypothetical protein MTR67_005506 [Solanum verrucosum]|uniref:GDSL esterase/lipase n=1 Tax=Solanum verrucosum TaxID=315347 RepID=A0AAF0PWE2_SOLVR|nr:hypothetical protein MTR67_005506 [Solanum verrucosum]
MVYIDFYDFTFDLINNPTKYGYKITKNGCCALVGKIELLAACPIACSKDYEYVFWDGFHLTEKGYRLLVNQVLQQHLQTFITHDQMIYSI